MSATRAKQPYLYVIEVAVSESRVNLIPLGQDHGQNEKKPIPRFSQF